MCIGTWPRTACQSPGGCHADHVRGGRNGLEWNHTEMVERWAKIAHELLAESDVDAPIDLRSLEGQGIALQPSQIGPPAQLVSWRPKRVISVMASWRWRGCS